MFLQVLPHERIKARRTFSCSSPSEMPHHFSIPEMPATRNACDPNCADYYCQLTLVRRFSFAES